MGWKEKMRRRPAETPAAPPPSEAISISAEQAGALLVEIRDLLKQQAADLAWLRKKVEDAGVLGT